MRAVRIAAIAAALALVAGSSALAQAWVPRAGTGSVSLVFQTIDNTGHILTDGSTIPFGKSRDAAIYLEADYAVTDRLSISAGVPFVFAKYLGPRQTPEPPIVRDVDRCYCWQKGLQDFNITTRFNLLNGAAAITPSLSIGLPTHDYTYIGEAVVGRKLKEVRLAVDVGRRLDFISPRVAIQGRYSYAFVERILDVPNNRSNASGELIVRVSDRVSVHGSIARQITHGGLRAGVGSPADAPPWGEITTLELLNEHDRLLRDNNWRVGGGASMSVPGGELFLSYLEFVAGSDTHAGRAFSAGFSVPFGG